MQSAINSAPEGGEFQARRIAVLRGFESVFFKGACVCVAVSVGGIVWTFFLRGSTQGVVIGVFDLGGLWLAAMFLVIKRRVRTGPKAEYLRASWKGLESGSK
jgi:hypothetical protein